MSDQKPSVFDIGSQQAGTINNVAGDMTISEQRGEATFAAGEPLRELERVRAELARASLPPETRRQADACLADADAALRRPQPDRDRAAGRLCSLTRLLRDAGALAAAGTALIDPLSRLATWLGPAGLALATLLL